MNNLILPIISGLSFYLFPILTGRAVVLFLKKGRERANILYYFAIGGLVLYGLMLLLTAVISALPLTTKPDYLRAILVVFLSLASLVNLSTFKDLKVISLKRIAPAVLTALFLSLAVVYLWRRDNPFPQLLNWDIFEHQTLVNYIKRGQLHFISSRISDTFQFDGYSTLFHALLSIPQITLGVEPFAFWWSVEYFHLFLTILASFLLAKTVTRSNLAGLLTAIISAFVFESYVIYSSLFLIPQTLAAVLSVFMLIYVLEHFKDKKYPWIPLAIIAVTIFLSHYIIGLATILTLSALIFLYQSLLMEKRLVWGLSFIILPLTVFALLTALSGFLHLDQLNSGEAALFTYTLTKKAEFAQVFYGYALYILLPVGALLSLHLKEKAVRILLLLTAVILAVVLAGIPYSLKFYVLGRYLTHLFMGLGLWMVIKSMSFRLMKVLSTSFIAVIFMAVFILNLAYWKNPLRYQGHATNLESMEIAAGRFLQEKFEADNTFLISDPSTQYVLEATSDINTQGGAYMNLDSRKILVEALEHPYGDQFAQKLTQIKDTVNVTSPNTYLLALSGRFFEWQEAKEEDKLSLGFNVWKPYDLALNDLIFIENLKKTSRFKEVYRNESLVILQFTPGNNLGFGKFL